MPVVILLLSILVATSAGAESAVCEGSVPLDKVKNICGIEFIKEKAKIRKAKCSVTYIDKAMGKKYVDGVGSSPLLIMQSDHELDSNGQNTAPVSFNDHLELAKERDIFVKEVSGLGEAAFYIEHDNFQTVIWFKGERLNKFTVKSGRGEVDDKEWPAPCTADQTIEIAKLIGEQDDS